MGMTTSALLLIGRRSADTAVYTFCQVDDTKCYYFIAIKIVAYIQLLGIEKIYFEFLHV